MCCAVCKRQDLINNCLNKTMKSATSETTAVKPKDKININIFLSQDVQDDGYSDNEAAPQTTVSVNACFVPCFNYNFSCVIKVALLIPFCVHRSNLKFILTPRLNLLIVVIHLDLSIRSDHHENHEFLVYYY